MFETRNMKAVIVAAAIASAIYLSGLLVILAPLPLLFVYAVFGRRQGILTSVLALAAVSAAFLLSSLFLNSGVQDASIPLPGSAFGSFLSNELRIGFGIGYFIFFIVVAIALAEGMIKRLTLFRMGGYSIAASLAVLVSIGISFFIIDDGLAAGLKGYLVDIVNEIVELNKSSGVGGAQIDMIADKADGVASFILRIMPALVIVYTLLIVAINFLLGRRLMEKRGLKIRRDDATGFRLPDELVWTVIGSGALFFLDKYFIHADALGFVAINSLIIFLSLYFLQGMAVISHLLRGVRMPLLRTLAYVLIILFFKTISVAIVAVGLADVWANFRIRKLKAEHNHYS